jgi:hypothetical protein
VDETRARLRTVCDDPPDDLVDYFDHVMFGRYSDSRIGLLLLDQAVEATRACQPQHPLMGALGVVILDDAGISNCHGYITRGPLAGYVLYIIHDDVSRIVFDGLEGYLDALELVLDGGRMLDLLHFGNENPFPPVIAHDQVSLTTAVKGLLEHPTDEGIEELIVYLPTMELTDLNLLDKLARHPDMYVVESLGNEIARRPRPELKPVAAVVSKHQHFQAREAGKRALKAIKEIENQ